MQGSGFPRRSLSSKSELLKARSGLQHLPTPAPGSVPCTEGTFTKVHCSVRGLGRHQEGLSGSWVQMTGAGSLRSGLLRRGQRPTALRQRWALALASLFPEWVRLGGKEDAGPRSCLPGAGPQPSAWTRNRDGRERLSGQAWNAVLPASPPAPPHRCHQHSGPPPPGSHSCPPQPS